MVYEFPELQGIMGRHYALIDGEDPLVAQAVFEHYLPRFAGDDIPASHPGIAVSLAEKFDNLIGNFAIGVKPSGSQDPFALRRQALGIVAIILEAGLQVNMEDVIRRSYREFEVDLDLTEDETVAAVLEFILLRFRGVLAESGLSYDVLDAGLAVAGSNLLLIRDKIQALAAIKQAPFFDDLMVVFNRPYNLSRKAGEVKIERNLFKEEEELALFNSLKSIEAELDVQLKQGDYLAYCEKLAGLRPCVDDFFEKIMVMVEDEAVRNNRLALLKMVVGRFMALGDLSKVVM
jgi:glycyl-tRNA synthetase beta chain